MKLTPSRGDLDEEATSGGAALVINLQVHEVCLVLVKEHHSQSAANRQADLLYTALVLFYIPHYPTALMHHRNHHWRGIVGSKKKQETEQV